MDPKAAADVAAKVATGASPLELATILLLIFLAAKTAFDLARLWYGRKKDPTPPQGLSAKQGGLMMKWVEQIHKNVVGDSTLGADGLAVRLGGLEANMETVAAALQATSDNLKEVAASQKEIATTLREIERSRNGASQSDERLAQAIEGLNRKLAKG